MRKFCVLFCLFLLRSSVVLFAQNANQRIADCINREDWFALRSDYPVLKDSLSDPMLRWYSQAMLGVCFNCPGEAMVAIDTLLTGYQAEIGASGVVGMVYLKTSLLEQQGRYKEAIDLLGDFLLQALPVKGKEELEGMVRYYDYLKELREERPPVLKRPKRDVTVPVAIEKSGKGDHLFIPVKVHGKEYPFIFDTGAERTILSKEYADLLGVRIVYDSLTINGIGGQSVGALGVIDRMEVGKIIYKNVVVAVAPDNPRLDSIYKINAILGCDFMKAIGEIHLLPEERKVVFPYLAASEPGVRKNMMCNFILPYVEGTSEDETLVFQFDTGNELSNLNYPFYEKHKDWIDHYGIPEISGSGGLGGIHTFRAYRLRSFPLCIGNVGFEMKDLSVNAEALLPIHKAEDGSLGMSFVLLFDKVILNFKEMYLQVVK